MDNNRINSILSNDEKFDVFYKDRPVWIGYAYLMYNGRKELNDLAVKRLNTIKEFTELGSGFKIAMRDLSIRGAGDILGSEQSGFIDSIGIDLYLKMLKEEVDKLKGIKIEEEKEESSKPLIEVETHISNEYAPDDEIKLEVHKLINNINSEEDIDNLCTVLRDRFGKVTDEMIVEDVFGFWMNDFKLKFFVLLLI